MTSKKDRITRVIDRKKLAAIHLLKSHMFLYQWTFHGSKPMHWILMIEGWPTIGLRAIICDNSLEASQ